MPARLRRRHSPSPSPPLTRITYIVDTPGYGGAEIYLQHLLRGTARRAQVSVLIAEPGVPPLAAVATSVGATVASFRPVRGKLDLVRLLQLTQAVERTDADVVHVNMTTATNNRYAIAAAWLAGVPAIATVHTPVAVGGARHTYIVRWLYRRLRAAVAVSDEIRRLLVDHLSVPSTSVHLITNGVDVAAKVTPVPSAVTRIVAVGRLEPEKRFDVLIDALRLLVERDVPVELVVAGEGSQRATLAESASGLPVHLPGFIAESARVWGGADLFCLPSGSEGLPFALLEAMMRGLPCVASDVGDVASAVGDAGVLVPPGDPVALADAIEALAGDPARRTRLGAAARERALSAYDVDVMVERTLRLIDAAASRADHATPREVRV
jgi:glycosyltransferase involved in cell wall biosynthesis